MEREPQTTDLHADTPVTASPNLKLVANWPDSGHLD
jgi:hypothetical protein